MVFPKENGYAGSEATDDGLFISRDWVPILIFSVLEIGQPEKGGMNDPYG
jgi:hypothetical protein